MMTLVFRAPTPSDAAAIAEIDGAGLATGHATFRTDPYDWQKFETAYLLGRGFARIADRDSRVLGWAGVVTVSDRCVYSGVGEVSVYVASAAQGKGIGKALLQDLVQASEAKGYWTLIAQIFPENTGSLALHQACGFRPLGRRERLGRMTYGPMSGLWRDTILLERRSTVTGTD